MKPKLLGGQMMYNGFFGLWMLLGIITAAILPVGLGWGFVIVVGFGALYGAYAEISEE